MTNMTRHGYYRLATALTRASCALLAVAVVLGGCEEEDLRAYEAPKSDPYTEPELFISAAAPQPAAVDIAWDMPGSWNESPNSSSILFAVFEADGGAGPVRITVTKLRTDGGGVLANINRWRGQVGLGPVDKIENQPMALIQAGGSPAGLIDLASPEGVEAGLERMMVVMLPRQQDNLTWYFKMTGPTAALDEQMPAFVSFVESVHFGDDAGDESRGDTGADSEGISGGDSGE
jgi:hypothetical protein